MASVILLAFWAALLRPFTARDVALFLVSGTFMLFQNYLALKDGVFEFRDKDVLLMPYYEPLLWGLYFTVLRYLIDEGHTRYPAIGWRAVAALAATSAAFGAFSFDPRWLLVATAISTAFLFLLFHDLADVYYAVTALMIGAVVEVVGVSAHIWRYPSPDIVGIPYWFATMWLSVGILGRRFAIPVADWVSARVARQA